MEAFGSNGLSEEPVSVEEIAMTPAPWSRQASCQTYTSQMSRIKPSSTRPPLKKQRSVRESVADFFGVGEDSPADLQKWRRRSLKHAQRRTVMGQVKPDLARSITLESVYQDGSHPSLSSSWATQSFGGRPLARPIDPLALSRFGRQESQQSYSSLMFRQLSRQQSIGGQSRRTVRPGIIVRRRKDSVAKMAYDGIKNLMSSSGSKRSKKKPSMHGRRSFTPTSISSCAEEHDIPRTPCTASDSVFGESFNDDVFFDLPAPTSPYVTDPSHLNQNVPAHPPANTTLARNQDPNVNPFFPPELLAKVEEEPAVTQPLIAMPHTYVAPVPELIVTEAPDNIFRPTRGGWQVGQHQDAPEEANTDQTDGGVAGGMRRIVRNIMDSTRENSNRREVGKGLVGQLLNRAYRMDRMDSMVQGQLDELDDHRPYFTYWATFVQITIYIIAVAVYGLAPLGFEETEVMGEVMLPSLSIERVSYFEKDNFWIGPRQADLIHLGAKYSPCMRHDFHVEEAIAGDRALENTTACCIRNDGSGCVQTLDTDCSPTLATWYKWYGESSAAYRTSGSVCGQDPRLCSKPVSLGAFEWLDDITLWPICLETEAATATQDYIHMTCEVVGRPCCKGIQGECIITTPEYCQFLHGYFHQEARLCSQVSCMNEICGMIPFLNPSAPDQFYRLWTTLFLHAGLLQLVISVIFQFFIMRDMEKLAGWLRIGIIYIGSGIAGSLSSSIFLPYHVEAGPSGCQFGILACLFVEVIQNWQILQNPWWALGKLLLILVFLFVIGLLPMVDNYAHLVGFVFGFLLSFAFLPYVYFGKFDRQRKLVTVIVCLVIAIGAFSGLILLFYVMPIYHCPNCSYFNCIPFTSKFCDSMEVEIRRNR